jgi:hypothetical protein
VRIDGQTQTFRFEEEISSQSPENGVGGIEANLEEEQLLQIEQALIKVFQFCIFFWGGEEISNKKLNFTQKRLNFLQKKGSISPKKALFSPKNGQFSQKKKLNFR